MSPAVLVASVFAGNTPLPPFYHRGIRTTHLPTAFDLRTFWPKLRELEHGTGWVAELLAWAWPDLKRPLATTPAPLRPPPLIDPRPTCPTIWKS